MTMPVLDATRLCVDCVHLQRTRANWVRYAHCLHPSSLKMHEYLVTGDTTTPENYFYASTARDWVGHCGPHGKNWQSKAKVAQLQLPAPLASVWGWLRTKIKVTG